MRDLAVALGWMTLWMTTAFAQQGEDKARSPLTERELVLRLPAEAAVSDETWNRIRMDYAEEQVGFLKLLLDLDRNRIDYTVDDLSKILEKRRKMKVLLNAYATRTIARQGLPRAAANYVSIERAAAPWLTGQVIELREGKPPGLDEAILKAQPGDTIRLGPGEFKQEDPRAVGVRLNDVAIVGAGRDKTTVRFGRAGGIRFGQRVLIADARIDCANSPFLDLRDGSAVVRDCHIFNYNSGAGGSNAIFGVQSVFLVEDCTFDGEAGRAEGHSQGSAFDLRGDCLLYVRNTTFVDNMEIVRASFPCVFDNCSSRNQSGREHGIMPYQGGLVFLRNNRAALRGEERIEEFILDTDDIELIEAALGGAPSRDGQGNRLVTALRADRNLNLLIGLMLHRDAGVRGMAANRISTLLGKEVGLPRDKAKARVRAAIIDETIARLGDSDPSVSEAAEKKLVMIGERALVKLRSVLDSGTPIQKRAAENILEQWEGKVTPWEAQVEYGRVSHEYAKQR